MAWTPLAFSYRQRLTATVMNQVAENFAIVRAFLDNRQALPHARVRHTSGGGGISALTWWSVPMNTTPADGGSSPQPWTITSTGITVNETGLYLFTVTTSMSEADFTTRILNVNAEPDVTLAQNPAPGTSTHSRSNNLTAARRLVAGDRVVWQVYKQTDGAITPDAPATPCYLDIIRLSD